MSAWAAIVLPCLILGGIMTNEERRIQASGVRGIGPINWLICRIAARAVKARQMNLFLALAPHRRLFWAWLPFSGMLLGGGRLPREDTELVILRVGHLCDCEYELQHHRRIAAKHGLDATTRDMIVAYPDATELSYRQQALLDATDELVLTHTISHDMWARLRLVFDEKQLIELCVLVAQYEALATTISALGVSLDFPE